MTLDTNHLRQLLAEATRGPWTYAGEGRVLYAREGGWDVAECLHNPKGDGEFVAALRNDAGELLDRSDALDKALRLLRDLPPETCGECLDGVRGSGEDCCVREDLEQHRWGRKRADLLARFPEEATE